MVRAKLDKRRYPIGKRISEKEMRLLNIEKDRFHGDWNYTINPRDVAA